MTVDESGTASQDFYTCQPIDWQCAVTFLKPLKQGQKIGYGWSIAQKLAAAEARAVTAVAAELVLYLSHQLTQSKPSIALALPALVLPALRVSATETGLIQLELTDWAIAQWLGWLLQANFSPVQLAVAAQSELTQSPEFCFSLQYSHARCCSLLRLAHESEIITLASIEEQSPQWEWLQPTPIHWLGPQLHQSNVTNPENLNLSAQPQLLLQHVTERQLIKVLFAAADALQRAAPRSPKQWTALATATVSAFQAFHRDRPLWAARPIGYRSTLQAQFGLIMATQRVLLHLLNKFQIQAPTEL